MKLLSISLWLAFGTLFTIKIALPEASMNPTATRAQARKTVGAGCAPAKPLATKEFESVMQTIADGWNQGNAGTAASCFTEDAVYSGPPSRGHRGRKSLYAFFGGAKGREMPMHMEWHNLIFDPERQVGAGEYTFRYQIQTHGIVIVKLSNGLIRNWREYEVESNLPWEQFIGDNHF